MTSTRRSPIIEAYLRLLGNPYASLQIDDDPDAANHSEVAVGVELAQQESTGDQLTERERLYIRRLEDPYALLSIEVQSVQQSAGDARVSQNEPLSRVESGEATKARFQDESRRIFRPYIPALERGRLRDYHRAFIARNEDRSPKIRFELLSRLRKYDLSNIHGIEARFNRQNDALTDEKLKQIEDEVLGIGE